MSQINVSGRRVSVNGLDIQEWLNQLGLPCAPSDVRTFDWGVKLGFPSSAFPKGEQAAERTQRLRDMWVSLMGTMDALEAAGVPRESISLRNSYPDETIVPGKTIWRPAYSLGIGAEACDGIGSPTAPAKDPVQAEHEALVDQYGNAGLDLTELMGIVEKVGSSSLKTANLWIKQQLAKVAVEDETPADEPELENMDVE